MLHRQYIGPMLIFALLLIGGCMQVNAEQDTGLNATASNEQSQVLIDTAKAISVTDESFVCLKKMRPIRGFFVGNLLNDIEATATAAKSKQGAIYPPGSIVQLIPAEAMVKHKKGWSPATKDWEFFELDVSKAGTKIKVRGTTEVVNKFGGNCFGCHVLAEPQWDLLCEDNHGCEPLPIPDFLIRWTQRNDPRCD